MSDLVERALLKIADDGYAIGCCTITDREARELARDIALEIAAMRTDAAPALKPAMEVWEEASKAGQGFSCSIPECEDCKAAAAVIEADRQAIIAAKDAEIAALQAHADALAGAGLHCADDLEAEANERWGHDDRLLRQLNRDLEPVRQFRQALRAYEEFRR